MKEGAGGGDEEAVGAEGLEGALDEGEGLGVVVAPDVAAVHDAEREGEVGGDGGEEVIELVWGTGEVEVEGVDGEGEGDGGVVAEVAEVGGEEDFCVGDGLADGLVGGWEGVFPGGVEIED